MGVEKCSIPKRYILVLLGFIGMLNMYAMRISLSVTIVAMVNSTTKHSSNITSFDEVCPNLMLQAEATEPETFIGPQYNWDIEEQGLILASFYYGYIINQVPAGFIAERIGAKWLFGVGVLNTAILTLLTPFVARWGAVALIVLRIVEGLGEGMTFPTLNLLITKWSPKIERSRLSTIVFTGMPIGSVLSMPIAGWLSGSKLLGGWPSVFYLFGTFSCIWFIFWAVLVYETPAEHPTIDLKEIQYVKENNDGKIPKTPWKAIFSSLPMWAICIAQFGQDFGFVLFLSDLPTYFSTVLHYNIKENGLLSALPFVVQAIFAWIASYFADRLRQSKKLSITNIRKIFNTVGLIGPALCLLGITVAGCRPYLIIIYLTIGMALNGFSYSGYNVTHIDMCPNFAGTTYAITNIFGCITAFTAPAVVAALIKTGPTVENWNTAFYITAGIYVFGAVFFAAFASAEPQSWGAEKEDLTIRPQH